METIEIVGLVAAILTTASFVPQVFKAWREKTTAGVSLTMYLLFFVGVVLWLIYGIHHQSIPIIFANAITVVLVVLMLIFKVKYK